MAIRRETLADNGVNWPEDVGPGTEIPIGDERLFLYVVSPPESNDRLYVPGAIVHHNIEHEQVTFAGALRRFFLMGRSDKDMMLKLEQRKIAYQSNIKYLLQQILTSKHICEIFCIFARLLGRKL